MQNSLASEAGGGGLAQVVRQRRRELGLTQMELADLAGCSARFVHELEHAKPMVALGKVHDVLDALGLRLVILPRDVTAEVVSS